MSSYADDERQRPIAPWPPPVGLALNRPSAASHRLNGFNEPGFRRWLLASGRFKANQRAFVGVTEHYGCKHPRPVFRWNKRSLSLFSIIATKLLFLKFLLDDDPWTNQNQEYQIVLGC